MASPVENRYACVGGASVQSWPVLIPDSGCGLENEEATHSASLRVAAPAELARRGVTRLGGLKIIVASSPASAASPAPPASPDE